MIATNLQLAFKRIIITENDYLKMPFNNSAETKFLCLTYPFNKQKIHFNARKSVITKITWGKVQKCLYEKIMHKQIN